MLILDHGKFDREVMSKFYKRFHEDLIEGKSLGKQSMFFEPPYFPDTMNIEGGQVFNVGFEESPGSIKTSVLNDHSYCC